MNVSNKAKEITVIAMHKNGRLTYSTLAALNAADLLAKTLGGSIAGLAPAEAAGEMSLYVPKVYAYSGSLLGGALAAAKEGTGGFILPASFEGRAEEIGGAVSAALGWGMLSNCLEAFPEENGGGLAVKRKALAGTNLIEESRILSDGFVLALAPSLSGAASVSAPGRIMELNSADVHEPDIVNIIKRQTLAVSKTRDLPYARIIVAGGRGCGSADGYKALALALAEKLGGEYAGSRAAVDAGWIPSSRQIGLSGHTAASADLYIALGISGAGQHIVGMETAGCIVAINRDLDAPIFNYADYGIAGDLFDIVPALLEKL